MKIGQTLGWISRSQEAEAEVKRLRQVIINHAARLARLDLLPPGCGDAAERRMLDVSYHLLDAMDERAPPLR